jgi:hypothetical protein
MRTRTVLTAAVLVLLVGLLIAPCAFAATALKAKVRVAGLDREVIPPTAVAVPRQATAVDSIGTEIVSTNANAFSAFAIAAAAQGIPYETNGATTADAVFINTIQGLGIWPTSWWGFSVNGWFSDIGAGSMALRSGDSLTFFEVPGTAAVDASFLQLVVRPVTRALLPGQAVEVKVVADDLAKADSSSDADRFGTGVETPAAFKPVEGATVHVGAQSVTTDADGTAVVSGLPNGTYGVWAEKADSASTVYLRSTRKTVDIAPAPRVTRTSVTPSPYRLGYRMRVRFRLSTSATARLTVRNSRGRTIGTAQHAFGSGFHTLTWKGTTSTRYAPVGSRLRVRVKATDGWGRSTATALYVRVRR